MLHPPSDKPLPRQGDPRKFAQQGVHLQGAAPISAMPRLAEALADDQGQVQADLTFGISQEGKKVLTGKVEAGLTLICQRCLEPVVVPVSSQLSLAILWSEEEVNNLPRHLDPWIAEEGVVDLYPVIEEELLLGLPSVAYHPEPCVDSTLFSSGEPEAAAAKPRENPFHVLEQLKGSPKS